jgi:hypothetical protein
VLPLCLRRKSVPGKTWISSAPNSLLCEIFFYAPCQIWAIGMRDAGGDELYDLILCVGHTGKL